MSRSTAHVGFRRLCERHELTQQDAAHAAGISQGYLSNFLAGRVPPGARCLVEQRLADLFYSGNLAAMRRVLARRTSR